MTALAQATTMPGLQGALESFQYRNKVYVLFRK